jgi:hypothetical protein
MVNSAKGCHVPLTDALRADAQALLDELHTTLETLSKPLDPHLKGPEPFFVTLAHIDDDSTAREEKYRTFSQAFANADRLVGNGQLSLLNGLLNGFGDHVTAAGHLSRLMGIYADQPGFKELLEHHGKELAEIASTIGSSPEFASDMQALNTSHREKVEKPSEGWAQGY